MLRPSGPGRRGRGAPWPILCAIGAMALMNLVILSRWLVGAAMIDDDAFYYFVIARNIASTGASTFDHQSLTNGYHPLWLLALVLQYLTVGPSVVVSLLLQPVLISLGLYGVLRGGPATPGLWMAAFTIAVLALLCHFALGGMESALLVFCLGLFVVALRWVERGRAWRGAVAGLAAAACIGARIDCALFMAVAVILAPVSRPARRWALAVLAVLGGVYVAYNLAMFGMALPVSGAVKSLGGLQLNARALSQIGLGPDPGRLQAILVVTIAALAGSPGLLLLSRPHSLARTFAWASFLGGMVFLARIFFASSWKVWPWYNIVLIFPLTAAYYVGPGWIGRLLRSARLPLVARLALDRRAAAILVAAAGAGVVLSCVWPVNRPSSTRFDSISHMALQRYGPILGRARAAMGDRAGSFAMEYPGSVVQLEGLVNDGAYLAALRRGGDLRPLLCARGVGYLLDFNTDLGAYDRVRIPAMRPFLTQFPGPTVEVWRSDEVGQVQDPRLYDNRAIGEVGNNILYIWRLRCGPARPAAISSAEASGRSAR